MPRSVLPRRAAGVLLPISALPSPGPIGDLGPAAYTFVDWLVRAGQRYWQILPLSLPDSHGSPYASPSSMAGNWMYVSQHELIRTHLLSPKERPIRSMTAKVIYRQAARVKWQMIRRSWKYFHQHGFADQHRSLVRFRQDNANWLTDFTLYQALKDRRRHQAWWTWPSEWRSPVRARQHLDWRLRRQMDIHAYAQWLFTQQWQRLHDYAHRRRIDLIGDLPFYVQDDSVEVWSRPRLFELDRRGRPRVVSGVPADDFSRTGQRWGNPVYRWSTHRREHFSWWRERLGQLNRRVDVVRLDHFQGFAETYHIPANAPDGRRGTWVKTPGHQLLRTLVRHLPRLRIVAEDIGHPEPDAEYLRHHYGFPGIRLLQFGWSGLPDNMHHLQYVPTNCLYFTSTHDTKTIIAWWHQAKWYERKHFRDWTGRLPGPIHWQIISVAYHSRAKVAMVPAQDILGQGKAARLNRPGRVRGNWSWRMPSAGLPITLATKFRKLTRQSKRG